MLRGEEALAEVAADYFFFIADGGEINAGVPALEYIDVHQYTSRACRNPPGLYV